MENKTQNNCWTVIIEEDINTGDFLLPLPKELFEGEDPWLIDDVIEWSISNNNTAIITNKSWLSRKQQSSGKVA